MRICPECDLELPDGIPTCPDCDVPMIDPEELQDDFEPETDDYRYVFLRNVATRLYANMVKEALRNQGIPSIIQSDDVGIMLGNHGTASCLPVRILVPACYRNRAKRIAWRIAGEP